MTVKPHSTRSAPRLPRQLVDLVTAWPVASQQRARRNAMIAATSLAQRRAEREAVEDFLAARSGHADEVPDALEGPSPRTSGL